MLNKTLTVILATILLSGCNVTNPIKPNPPVVVTSYKYIVIKTPKEMLEVPKPIETPDPETANDKDVAQWMLDKEGRAMKMEKTLKSVEKYQEDRLNLIKSTEGIKDSDILE